MVNIGMIYHHFKGNNYKVLNIGRDAETEEIVVIYEALYGNHDIWVRTLNSFTSKIDRNKYPNIEQKYRFEEIK